MTRINLMAAGDRVRRERGFSLLEILFVLSIVSILAVVAVPMYVDYKVRAEISEGFVLAEPVKAMVTEYHETTGTWPDSNAEAAVEAPPSFRTDYVDAISVASNAAGVAITVTFRIPALGGDNTIILTPSDVTGNRIEWSCKQGTVVNKFRPAVCKA